MRKIITVLVMLSMFVAMMSVGCIENEGSSGETQALEAKLTEDNQQRLIVASPPPELTKSLERENLIKRLEVMNDEDEIFYVYLVSYGNVMAFYTAHGKISSVNSKLTTGEQIVYDPYRYQSGGKVVESPSLDGSYGSNGDAIFFFTTEGAYVEWAGEYMISNHPLKLTTPPKLVRNISGNSTS